MTALREILSSISADNMEIPPVSEKFVSKSRTAPGHAGGDSAMVQALIEAMMLCPERDHRRQVEDCPLVSGAIF